jgi:hypothetical protein
LPFFFVKKYFNSPAIQRFFALKKTKITSPNFACFISKPLLGELIIKKQAEFGWGKSVILMLSQDLPQLIGEGVSWSPRNLQFMKQLVTEYSNVNQAGSHLENENAKQAVSHLDYVKQLILKVPLRHNI